MSEANTRATRWFLTINNYTEEDIHFIESETFISLCKYMIYGKEQAPSTSTNHLHLYFRLKSRLYKNYQREIFFGPSQFSMYMNFLNDNLKINYSIYSPFPLSSLFLPTFNFAKFFRDSMFFK